MKKSVEEQLYYAAKMENVAIFEELFLPHQFVVEQAVFFGSRNMLHIATAECATVEGRERIVELLLEVGRQLAQELDDKKSLPLHIVVAKGHVGIARMLFSVAREMCWRLDDHGMNPVHVAAANGHVDVLRLLLEHDLSPGMELLEGRRSVLSLSVKHR